jgi:hypothetical protein
LRCSIVNLGLLKLAAEIDVHRLPFGEDVQRGIGRFAMAVSGLLGASEGELNFGPMVEAFT